MLIRNNILHVFMVWYGMPGCVHVCLNISGARENEWTFRVLNHASRGLLMLIYCSLKTVIYRYPNYRTAHFEATPGL